ncbi:MAG: FAD-dependent oxidoreductase, partial [Promethearchaeota archaeon]
MSELLYDLAIIGAGPGGYHAAIRAAQYGAKVALIEKDKLGGTCLNRGCIPTKALYSSVQSIERLKDFDELGIEIKDYSLNFKKAVERKNRVVEELVGGIEVLEKAWKNDLFYGHGKIIGGDIHSGYNISIQGTENKTIKAKRVIIATGSSPALIPSFNIDHEKILTSDDILEP